jgi:hypothetical protein
LALRTLEVSTILQRSTVQVGFERCLVVLLAGSKRAGHT